MTLSRERAFLDMTWFLSKMVFNKMVFMFYSTRIFLFINYTLCMKV